MSMSEIARVDYMEDGYRGVHRKIDEIRAGVWGYTAYTSNSQAAVFAVPSNKLFYLDTLIINSDGAAENTVILYDSTGTTVPVTKITLGPTETVFVTGFRGLVFSTSAQAAPGNASGMQITMGGFLVDNREKL